jgi:hypothetical protein
MSAFQSFSPVTSKTFCVVTAPQLDGAAALASTSSAVLPPRTPATGRSSTGMLHFHSHNANIVVERFAFGKLANVVIGAIRPVGTAPNSPGLRTNQGSMPKFKSPKISTNFAHATASTTDATTRGIQRNVPSTGAQSVRRQLR